MKNNYPLLIISSILFLVFIYCRCVDLRADLPSYFDTGISVTDEGTYMDAPRKKVQTGQWNLAGEWWHSQKIVPLYSFVLKGWFEVNGVSLVSGRLLSVLFGLMTLVVCYAIGWRLNCAVGGGVMLLFVGSSYITTYFHRAAMVESMQLFFIWLLILMGTFRSSLKRDFFIGVVSLCVVLVKLSGALALVGFFLWYVFIDKVYRERLRILALIFGFLAPLLMIELFFPHFLLESFRYCQQYFGGIISIENFLWHFLHISVRSMYVSREFMIAILFLSSLFCVVQSEHKKIYSLCAISFVCTLLATCFADMSVRRYLLFMPWVYVLAFFGFFSGSNDEPFENPHNFLPVWLLNVTKIAGVFWVVSGVPMVLGHFNIIPIKVWVALGGLGVVLFVGCDLLKNKNKLLKKISTKFLSYLFLSHHSRLKICVIIFALFVLQYENWFFNRTHKTYDGIKKVAHFYQRHDSAQVLYGNIAPMMSLESKAFGFFMHEKMGSLDKWKLPATLMCVTYNKPTVGYESPIMDELVNSYSRRAMMFDTPMFSEANIQRNIALYRLEK